MVSTYLGRLTYVAIIICILMPVIILIFNFFGIPVETYLNYIFWAIALGIFYTIIPMSSRDIFS